MKTIIFRPEHLDHIAPREREKAGYDEFCRNLKEHYSVAGNQGFTLIHEGVVIACGGVYRLWENVGEAWIFGSEHIAKKPISFHKAVLRSIKKMKDSGMFHRIQSIVRVDWPESLRWEKMLGFEIEGKLEKYTPDGVDCFIYKLRGM